MIAIQTITAIDMPGKGNRKMPAPRAYVAAIILWAIYGLAADAGAERGAAAAGWVTVLTGAIVGSFGKTLTDFLNTVADEYGVKPASPLPRTGTGKTEKPASGAPVSPDIQTA